MAVFAQVDQQTPLQNDDNELVHQNKKKNELQSIKNDAMSLAMMSLYTGQKIRALMETDRYWSYVTKHDEHYADKVVGEAIKIKKEFKADPKKFLPLVPPKKDPQGGGGAGGAPMMGSSNARVVVANDASKIYLKRSTGEPYRIRDTVAGRVLAGKYPLYTSNGYCHALDLTTPYGGLDDRENAVMAPKNGNVAKMLDSLERDLPSTLSKALTEGISDLGIDSAAEMAYALISQSEMRAALIAVPLRLYDILPNLTKPSFVILLDTAGSNAIEPKEINELRIKIGTACDPIIQELLQALRLDGIENSMTRLEDGDKNPRLVEQRSKRKAKEEGERIEHFKNENKNHAPKILNHNEINNAPGRDMRSLVMTLMGSQDSKLILEAIKMVVYLMKFMYPLYEARKPTSAEIGRLIAEIKDNDWERSAPGITDAAMALRALVAAEQGNDAQFMETIAWARDIGPTSQEGSYLRHIPYAMGYLALNQKRDDIIKADPQIAIDPATKFVTNDDLINKLDISDPVAARVILKAWQRNTTDQSSTPDRMLTAKVMELAASGDKEAIEGLSRLKSDRPTILRIALSFENGMVKEWPAGANMQVKHPFSSDKMVDDLTRLKTNGNLPKEAAKMLAISIIDADPNSEILKILDVKPSDIMASKPTAAEEFIRNYRIDMDGQKIPTANEIHSLPENPLSLVKSLFLLKDVAGLAISLNLIAEKMGSVPNSKVEYALEYTMSALNELGYANEAQSILQSNKLRMDANGIRRILTPTMVPSSSVENRHILDCFETGDMISASRFTNILFRRNPAAVLETINTLPQNDIFAEMLDPAIRNSPGVPEWLRRKNDVEASVLPNGIVVVGRMGIYDVFDGTRSHCYACSKSDSMSIAWEKTQG